MVERYHRILGRYGVHFERPSNSLCITIWFPGTSEVLGSLFFENYTVKRKKGNRIAEMAIWYYEEETEHLYFVRGRDEGQDIKSVWWMPWRQESMKDAVNCENLRGAVSRL